MKKSLALLGFLLLIVAGILLLPESRVDDGKSTSADVTVGSLLALSGPDKSFGITQQRGMQIAIDQINENGGINGKTLTFEYADTKLTEDLGLQEYKRLVGDVGVQAIVGITGSGVNLRLAPFAEKDQVVIFDSLATSPKLTKEGGNYFFRNIASDAYAGVVLSEWAIERDHKRIAVVFNSENSWSTGLESAVIEALPIAGGKFVMDSIAVLNSTDNFNSSIVSIRDKSPDAVFVCLMGRQAGLFVSQAKAANLDVPYYGTDPFSQQEFVDNAGDAIGQSWFVLPAENKSERYMEFEKEYQERFADVADSIAAKAYDSVYVFAAALKTLDDDYSGEAIQSALKSVVYKGITGENSFDQNNDLKSAEFDRMRYEGAKRVSAQ